MTRFAARTAALLCALLAGAVTLLAGAVNSLAAQEPRPTLRAGALNGELRLDGRLDEPAWRAADSIAGLTETEPRRGARPATHTIVRVLMSATTLIVGIDARDPEPAGIVSYAKQRDANLQNEDHIRLVLDSFLDGRSGYVFAINPGGSRFDALVANQGEGENSNWDAIWEAATARTADAGRPRSAFRSAV
jgi:hypothetical protein